MTVCFVLPFTTYELFTDL